MALQHRRPASINTFTVIRTSNLTQVTVCCEYCNATPCLCIMW